MKTIIISFLLLVSATVVFGQQINPSPQLTKQDYIRKSKNNNAFGWALLSTGALSTIISTVHFNFYGQETETGLNTGYFVAGLVTMGASIPFFVAASKNKKKAISLSLNNQPVPFIINGTIALRPATSIHLKIPL